MLRGGGKAAAESASEERNAGKGKATDAGGVEAKIETVKPAEEGRFDWKQGAEAAENPIEKYAQLRYHEDGTIVVTDDWRGQDVHRVPGKYRENIGKNIHLEKTESMHMTTIGMRRFPKGRRGS